MSDFALGLNLPTGLTAVLGALLWEVLRIVLSKWNITLPALPKPVMSSSSPSPAVAPVKDFKSQLQEFLEIRKLLKELQD